MNMSMMPMNGFLNMGSMNMGMGNMGMGNMGMGNMGMGNMGNMGGRGNMGMGGGGGGGGSMIPPGGFKKTKLCTKQQAGYCEKGDQCTFAHGDHELGTAQPSGAGHVNMAALGMGGSGFAPKPGDWCCSKCGDHQFAKNEQCRKCGGPRPFGVGGPAAGSNNPVPGSSNGDAWSEQNIPPSWEATGNSQGVVGNPGGFTKTKLCTRHESGYCEKGENCTFAHGEEQIGELQPAGGFNSAHAFGSGSGPQGFGAKPGDWSCSQCGDHQFAKNEQCRKCGAGRPDVASADGSSLYKKKPGDWFCPACNDLQFSKNLVCRKCNTPNPDPETSAAEAAAAQGAYEQEMKPGDWFCPSCNDLQFARNSSCRKCGTPNPHPEACLEAAAASGTWKTSAKPQKLPGDWQCSNCGNHVFAKHMACPRCGTANPSPTKGKGKGGDKGNKGKKGDKGDKGQDMAAMLAGGNFVVVPTEMFAMMMGGKGMQGMNSGGGGDSWGGSGDSWGGKGGGKGNKDNRSSPW